MGATWAGMNESEPQPCWLDRVNWLAEVLTPREAARLLMQLDSLLQEGERRMGRTFSEDERASVARSLRDSAKRNT